MNEQNAVWPFFAWNPFATSLAADMADFASALTQTASAGEPAGEKEVVENAQEIELVKSSRESDLVASAKRAMESLAKIDPAAAARVAREYVSNDSNEG